MYIYVDQTQYDMHIELKFYKIKFLEGGREFESHFRNLHFPYLFVGYESN